MSKKQRYWFCQITGWGLFYSVNYLAGFSSMPAFPDRFFYLLLAFFSEISFTHLFRYVIIKFDWRELSITQHLVRIVIASILISFAVNAVSTAGGYVLNILPESFYRMPVLLSMVISLTIINFSWSAIYFAVMYFENYKKATLDKITLNSIMKEFELKKLKAQLNPHFIFNSLNNIRALVKEDPNQAQKAITQLSNILRYSLLLDKKELVLFEEEVQIVSDYLELEAIRLEERLKVTMNINPKTLYLKVPPMMIQTLCENAIKHGISKRTKGGSIFVETDLVDNKLVIRIINDGIFNENVLETSDGFGVKNTKKRLSLLFGEDASFNLSNISGERVLAEINIPV